MDNSKPFSYSDPNLTPYAPPSEPTANQFDSQIGATGTTFAMPASKKKTGFFSSKKGPLFAAGGLMMFLILAAAGLALTRFQTSTDTRSQASAAKTAEIQVVETGRSADSQELTVYFDGSQLTADTKVRSFNLVLNVVPQSGGSQIQTQVLGIEDEVVDVDQLAQNSPTTTTQTAPVFGTQTQPAGAPMRVITPVGSPVPLMIATPTPKPSISPVIFCDQGVCPAGYECFTPSCPLNKDGRAAYDCIARPTCRLMPKPSASPASTEPVLGQYGSLILYQKSQLFKIGTPKITGGGRGGDFPGYPTLDSNGPTSTTPTNGTTGQPISSPRLMPALNIISISIAGDTNSQAYEQYRTRFPLFTIVNKLTDGGQLYTARIQNQSIRGYRAGMNVLVELTKAPEIGSSPKPTPMASPIIVQPPKPTVPPTTCKTGVNSVSYGQSCNVATSALGSWLRNNKGNLSVTVGCYDGYQKTLTSKTCLTNDGWSKQIQAVCAGRSNCPKPTTLPTPKPSVSPVPTPSASPVSTGCLKTYEVVGACKSPRGEAGYTSVTAYCLDGSSMSLGGGSGSALSCSSRLNLEMVARSLCSNRCGKNVLPTPTPKPTAYPSQLY